MAKKIAQKKKYLKGKAPVTPDTFEIEETPPPPSYSKWSPERTALIKKIESTLECVKTGQAFIIDTANKNTVAGYLSKAYPEEKFSFIIVPTNPEKVRVYRLAYNKK